MLMCAGKRESGFVSRPTLQLGVRTYHEKPMASQIGHDAFGRKAEPCGRTSHTKRNPSLDVEISDEKPRRVERSDEKPSRAGRFG